MRRIGSCLGTEVPESRWPHRVNACTFQTMKRPAEQGAAQMSHVRRGGAQTFFFKRGRLRHISPGKWRRTANLPIR